MQYERSCLYDGTEEGGAAFFISQPYAPLDRTLTECSGRKAVR